MAAGKSSRYGSLKQTEIIGPSDVTLIEYREDLSKKDLLKDDDK